MEGLSNTLRQEVKQFNIDVIVIEPGAVKSEWGNIAMEKLLKVSRKSTYTELAHKLAGISSTMGHKASEPIVTAKVIKGSIEIKTRKRGIRQVI